MQKKTKPLTFILSPREGERAGVRSRFCGSVFHLCICSEKIISLQHDRFSFGHDENLVLDAVDAGGLAQTFERFF